MSVPRGSSVKVEPYGHWNTDFSARQAVVAGTDYADLCCDEQRLLWVEFQPGDGRNVVVEWTEGGLRRLTPEGYSVHSRVYEYGGGALCLAGEALVFVNDADQALYHQALDSDDCQRLFGREHCRYGGLRFDARRRQVLAVEECHAGQRVTHRLVSIGLDGLRQVLIEGADFYNSPCLSPDGDQLAWIEWSRPDLPWTRTRLGIGQLDQAGRLVMFHYADSTGDESIQQPSWSPEGELICLSDRRGYWMPWRIDGDGGWQPLPAQTADHAPAPWQLNPQHYADLPSRWLALSWFEGGLGHLALRQRETAEERRLAHGYTRFRALTHNSHWLFCIAGSPTCSAAIVRINPHNGELSVLSQASSALAAADIAKPRRLLYLSGQGDTAHGFFYPPCNSQVRGPADQRPPLVIFTHGGPTSACYATLDNRIQFWTQRGFAVADLNYRGSSNFGRAYRDKLRHGWGQVDVEDVLAVIDHLAHQGSIDPERVFIRGQSAGGYTTLCSLVAASERFRAAASLYGVSDPLRLRAITHKFEADYIDWLIGHPQTDAVRYQQRSPLAQAERIRTPVIFFQGLQDAVVLPEQTKQMVQALEDNGVPVQCVTFAEERHGFRRPDNLARVLEQELGFYRAWL